MVITIGSLSFSEWQRDKYQRLYIERCSTDEREKLGYIDLKSGKVWDEAGATAEVLLASLEAEGLSLIDVLRRFAYNPYEKTLQEAFSEDDLTPLAAASSGEMLPTAYRIFYDGGCEPNPGPGYGSYAIFAADKVGNYPEEAELPVYRDYTEYGSTCTNNIAEYTALISGLEAVLRRIEDLGLDPAKCSIDVWGDSDLSVKQLNGQNRVTKPHLAKLHNQALALLKQFGAWRVRHHYRVHSLIVLGH